MSTTAPPRSLPDSAGYIIVATDNGTPTGATFQVAESNVGGTTGTVSQAPVQLSIQAPSLVSVNDCDFKINLHGTVNPTEFQESVAHCLSKLYDERS